MEPAAAAAGSRPVRLCRRTGRQDGAEGGRGGQQPSPSDGDGLGKETCANCRIARVRCCKNYPCERCFRLSMCCRPQVRALRRDSNTDVGGYEMPAATTTGHPQRGLVDVVFARANPRALADVYTQAVVELQRVGLLNREKALETARWWWVQSAATGRDASWGFLSAMAAALGFSAVDFEPPSWLARGPPRGQRQREARVLLEAAVNHMADLEQTPEFRHADDGTAAVAVGLPLPASPGYAEASNRTFKEMWRGMDELLGEDLRRHGTLGPILMLSLLAPDDRLTFARMMCQHTMTRNTRPLTTIVKVFNRQGDIKLYLLEVRPARILPDGGPIGFLFRAEVCPPSRHVTSAPNHAPLASTFRAISRPLLSPVPLGGAGGRGGDHAVGAGAGAGAARTGQQGIEEAVVLPGLSALPVPSPLLLSADDETRLVDNLGSRLYPPMAAPVRSPQPPPPPSPGVDGVSPAAQGPPPAVVDLGDGPRQQREERDQQRERQHEHCRPHAERGNPWGLDNNDNRSSPDSILPMPALDLDEEDEALLGRLFA